MKASSALLGMVLFIGAIILLIVALFPVMMAQDIVNGDWQGFRDVLEWWYWIARIVGIFTGILMLISGIAMLFAPKPRVDMLVAGIIATWYYGWIFPAFYSLLVTLSMGAEVTGRDVVALVVYAMIYIGINVRMMSMQLSAMQTQPPGSAPTTQESQETQ
ncbi:MAG: hypothetical protein DRO10_02400 [Thermoprotei archaeon]|nr:MAG: hypothetical protein DRO10_02400 [Thermoprotei archaeon]